MLRLRTTTSLSALALAIGIAGSAWLCTLTSGWPGPSGRALAVARVTQSLRHAPRHALRAHPWHGPVSVGALHRSSLSTVAASPPGARPSPALVPMSTPDDASQPWYQLRNHLQGRVLVHLRIDGRGQVTAARVAESSGDPVLDKHALRSVRSWRFHVPTGWPDGFSGDLPMRFTSPSERVANVP